MQECTPPTIIAFPTRTQVARELTIEQARQLLDWLEGHGIACSEITIHESGVTIAWDPPHVGAQ